MDETDKQRAASPGATTPPHWSTRLPFYYGWLIVAVAFVTMAIAVTARTAFSLLLPPLIDEFRWDRGLAAGAFSFGFLISAITSPLVGKLIDTRGPRFVIGWGVALMGLGLLTAPQIANPWQLYATLGLLVGGGANLMTYTTHSQFLPNWFVRRRALAVSLAFSGVGVGAFLLMPWLQGIIMREGWRASCTAMGLMIICVIGPLSLLLRRRPQDLGLLPDGAAQPTGPAGQVSRKPSNIVDANWAATEWTLRRAMGTLRFWCIMVAFFCATCAWYAIQVHQTKYLIEIGFTPLVAAWALGIVAVVAIPGQIGLGALSDRIGREWVWSVACLGFAICYAAAIALEHHPSTVLLYVMVVSQGLLGYAMTSLLGAIVSEIFEGPHFGSVFGVVAVALVGGGAVGPWVAGVVYDMTGSYRIAFMLGIACCVVSAVGVWIAAPGKVRLVAGRVRA